MAPPSATVAPPSATVAPPVTASPATPAPPQDDGAGGGWLLLRVVGAIGFLGAAGAGLFLRARRRDGRDQPMRTPADPDVPAAPPPVAGTGEEALTGVLRRLGGSGVSQAISQQIGRLLARPDHTRDALVQACVRYRDQLAENDGWQRDLLSALNAAGVREIRAEPGEVFDGWLHEAVDTVPAPTPADHDRIAQTVRCGYLDHDQVLRPPRVLVHRADPGPA